MEKSNSHYWEFRALQQQSWMTLAVPKYVVRTWHSRRLPARMLPTAGPGLARLPPPCTVVWWHAITKDSDHTSYSVADTDDTHLVWATHLALLAVCGTQHYPRSAQQSAVVVAHAGAPPLSHELAPNAATLQQLPADILTCCIEGACHFQAAPTATIHHTKNHQQIACQPLPQSQVAPKAAQKMPVLCCSCLCWPWQCGVPHSI